MPRISAPTVAEHHARQRRALLDAARAILAETGEAPSMGVAARRAGLARSSAYHYFSSVDDLLAAVVADVFPDWARRVTEHIAEATTPGARVWAYIEANIDLFASSEQAIAQSLARVVDPTVLQSTLRDFHAQLQVPLRQALTDLGDDEPGAMAEHIDALVMQASRELRLDPDAPAGTRERALSRLHRLLSGYLRLPAGPPPFEPA